MPLKRERFAEFYTELDASEPIAAVTVSGQVKLQREIARRRGHETSRGFLPVAAPATEIPDPKNEFYKSNEELQVVIAEAMRTEYKMKKYKMILYKMIVDAVLLLQLDDVRNRHLRPHGTAGDLQRPSALAVATD